MFIQYVAQFINDKLTKLGGLKNKASLSQVNYNHVIEKIIEVNLILNFQIYSLSMSLHNESPIKMRMSYDF